MYRQVNGEAADWQMCATCLEYKLRAAYPRSRISEKCDHEPNLCSACVTLSVNSQLRDGTAEQLTCPECQQELTRGAVWSFADQDLFTLYQRRIVDRFISEVKDFVWCPLGCGMGQVHHSGSAQPLVFCGRDNGYFCFRHRVAWHTDYTCEEYDAFLADPLNFRSKAQIQRAADQKRDLDDIERQMFLLHTENKRATSRQNLVVQNSAVETHRRLPTLPRQHEAELAQTKAKLEEVRRKYQEDMKHMKRLQAEEAATQGNISLFTKRCPKCWVRIEKNGGCDHMICVRCGSHFYWNRIKS